MAVLLVVIGISTESVSQDRGKNTHARLPSWHGLPSDTHRSLFHGSRLDKEKSRKGANV